jgi:hypothetical protein
MAEDEWEEDDIVGELAYVASHPGDFEKDVMVLVMRSAIANILEMRTEIAALKRGNEAAANRQEKA